MNTFLERYAHDFTTFANAVDRLVCLEEGRWVARLLYDRGDIGKVRWEGSEGKLQELLDPIGHVFDVTFYSECEWHDMAASDLPMFVAPPPSLADRHTWLEVRAVDGSSIVLQGAGQELRFEREEFLRNWDGEVLTVEWPTDVYPTKLMLLLVGRRFASRPTDVFISTVPKAGTTLSQTLLCALLHPQRIGAGESLHTISPFFEEIEGAPTTQLYANLPDPRCLKTHLPLQLLPAGARYIVMLRSPIQVLASYANHLHNHEVHGPGTWPDAVRSATSLFADEIMFDSWRRHFRASVLFRHREDVLFLQYQNAENNLEHKARKIADFLGIDRSDEEIRVAADMASLANMRTNWRHFAPKIGGIQKQDFFGLGPQSDWRRVGTEAARLCLYAVESMLADFGLDERDPELAYLKLHELRAFVGNTSQRPAPFSVPAEASVSVIPSAFPGQNRSSMRPRLSIRIGPSSPPSTSAPPPAPLSLEAMAELLPEPSTLAPPTRPTRPR